MPRVINTTGTVIKAIIFRLKKFRLLLIVWGYLVGTSEVIVSNSAELLLLKFELWLARFTPQLVQNFSEAVKDFPQDPQNSIGAKNHPFLVLRRKSWIFTATNQDPKEFS